MHYGNSRNRLSGSGQKTRRGRLRLRWGRVSQDVSNESPHGFIYSPRSFWRLLHLAISGKSVEGSKDA